MKLMRDGIIEADLTGLTPEERVEYYVNVCKQLGFDPNTLPLCYVVIDGELKLAINGGYHVYHCTAK